MQDTIQQAIQQEPQSQSSVPALDTDSLHATITDTDSSLSSLSSITLWHGSTSDLAEEIAREGLRPNPSRQWMISIQRDEELARTFDIPSRYKPWEMDRQDVVFISTSRATATWFAKAKVRYLAAPVDSHFSPRRGLNWLKEPIAPVIPGTRPILYKIRFPEAWITGDRLSVDERASHSFMFRGIIPPRYLEQFPISSSRGGAA